MQRYEARAVFSMFDIGVTALIGRGGKACRKGMRAMDEKYARVGEAEATRPVATPITIGAEDARLMLRARCGLCTRRCKEPLA
jgi:hypothetical protein